MPLMETPSIRKHALFCTAGKTLEKPKTRAIHSTIEVGLNRASFSVGHWAQFLPKSLCSGRAHHSMLELRAVTEFNSPVLRHLRDLISIWLYFKCFMKYLYREGLLLSSLLYSRLLI